MLPGDVQSFGSGGRGFSKRPYSRAGALCLNVALLMPPLALAPRQRGVTFDKVADALLSKSHLYCLGFLGKGVGDLIGEVRTRKVPAKQGF